jgi:hypothetical protein
MDGIALPDKETLNRLMAAKRWGDEAAFTVKRGSETMAVSVALRR